MVYDVMEGFKPIILMRHMSYIGIRHWFLIGMFKHVETQFWGMVLLYSILVHWVWFIFALTVSHMYGDVSKPWHQLGHFQSVASNLVAFPQFGATIIYHHDVYSWQASTSAETCHVLSTIAGHPATPAGREPWPPCRHVMHLERFLKTADEVGVIPQLDELDGSHISKSATWG